MEILAIKKLSIPVSIIWILLLSKTEAQYSIKYHGPDQHREESVDIHGNLRSEYGFTDPSGKSVQVSFQWSPKKPITKVPVYDSHVPQGSIVSNQIHSFPSTTNNHLQGVNINQFLKNTDDYPFDYQDHSPVHPNQAPILSNHLPTLSTHSPILSTNSPVQPTHSPILSNVVIPKLSSLFDKVRAQFDQSPFYTTPTNKFFTLALEGEPVFTAKQLETMEKFAERDIMFAKNMTEPPPTTTEGFRPVNPLGPGPTAFFPSDFFKAFDSYE